MVRDELLAPSSTTKRRHGCNDFVEGQFGHLWYRQGERIVTKISLFEHLNSHNGINIPFVFNS